MRRATRQRLLLIASVLVLVALAWWQVQRDERDSPERLLSLDPATITHVDLQPGKGDAEHYVKRGDQWWRIGGNGGADMPADGRRLRELTGVAAAPVQSWRPDSDFVLGKIGLDPPQASLTLDGQTLDFGTMAAISRLGYVHVGQRIALISLQYMPRAATSPDVRPQ